MLPKILIIVGTRPEIIKMAPVFLELKRSQAFDVVTCLTGQHRDLPKPFLDLFEWEPQYVLQTMVEGQSLNQLSSKLISGIERVIEDVRPGVVLVHGDTTTTLMGTIASFHAGIPVGHVEAGLRTQDISSPWPEEMNRKVTDQISSYFFAPTATAQSNLLAEGILEKQVIVTGNTIVDAVVETYQRLFSNQKHLKEVQNRFSFIEPGRKIILATNHRRENFGKPLENIFFALSDLSKTIDCQIVCPIHPNPKIRATANAIFKGQKNIIAIDPVDYPSSIYLQSISDLIITDSGGIQEESLILGRPLLVTRTATERPETLERTNAELVGTSREQIVSGANRILSLSKISVELNRDSALGDGTAAKRIVERLKSAFLKAKVPVSIHAPKRKHWVLLPAYNEQGNIGELLKRFSEVQSAVSGLKIVIVDDGSTDETVKEVVSNQKGLDVFILQNPQNQGLGPTFKCGVEHILRNSSDEDVLITMDADNSHLPEQIPKMIAQIESGHDLVIASRFIPQALIKGVPIHRQWLSRGLGFLFRIFYPIAGVKDYSSGFRAYRLGIVRRAFEEFGEKDLFFLDGFSCMLGFLVRVCQVGARAVEVPLRLRYDQKQGASKMKVFETVVASLKILLRARQYRFNDKEARNDPRISQGKKKTGT